MSSSSKYAQKRRAFLSGRSKVIHVCGIIACGGRSLGTKSCGSFSCVFILLRDCIHVQLHPDGFEVERGHVPASAPAVLCLLL